MDEFMTPHILEKMKILNHKLQNIQAFEKIYIRYNFFNSFETVQHIALFTSYNFSKRFTNQKNQRTSYGSTFFGTSL